jgi:uncharacterized protein (DUF486 family)
MTPVFVPFVLVLSAVMMSLAWLGHLRYREEWSFWVALGVSWTLVLPEYVLNTWATRAGHGIFSGSQMAAIHLASGVVCVAFVSRFVLKETMTVLQMLGFGLMGLSIVLIMWER